MSVTFDATSGKYIPQSSAEWTELLAGSGIANPSLLWLCQEASGDLADSIGTFTGTASIDAYQQAVTGWAAKAIVATDGAIRHVTNADSGLPDINTNSCMLFAWCSFPAGPAAQRSVVTFGPTYGSQVFADTDSTPRLVGGADPNAANGTANPFSSVHPLIVQVDRTAGAVNVQTDQETLSPTLNGTPTGKKLWLGGDNSQSWFAGGVGYIYVAVWFNADAELDAGHRATLLDLLTNGPPTPPPATAALPRWGSAAGVTAVPDNNTIGGIPVEHLFEIADAPSADHDIVVAHDELITSIEVLKTDADATVATVTFKNGTDAITDAMVIGVPKGTIVRPLTMDPDFASIVSGATLRATILRTTGNGAIRAIVRALRR